MSGPGKILFNRGKPSYILIGESPAAKWNKETFEIQVMRSTISSPNSIGGKVRKSCGSRMFPSPIYHKKQFCRHVSGYLCKWLDWVYQCEDFTFHFTSSFVYVNNINKSMIFHNIHVNSFMSPFLVLYYLSIIFASFLFFRNSDYVK